MTKLHVGGLKICFKNWLQPAFTDEVERNYYLSAAGCNLHDSRLSATWFSRYELSIAP